LAVLSGPNPLTGSFAPIINQLNTLSELSGLPAVVLPNVPPPAQLVGSYGQSLTNLFNNNFPTTEVQLRVSLPIRNRVAEANLSHAAAETRRIQNQREQIEQNINADVRNGMQGVVSAQLRHDAARVQRESAEEQYQSEQRQFRAGTSTLFLVQQRQTTMITARSQERRAEADLSEAIATYELATGTNLQRHNITVQ
jgi:HAE1 family hydrophobic/amphiphilic exporter-1